MQNFDLADYLLQHLNQGGALPQNRQLYRLIRQAILDKILPIHSRLPASRELARELGIARNTVLYAYEQLIAEGYLHTRKGSGSYVADTLSETLLNPGQKKRSKKTTDANALNVANNSEPTSSLTQLALSKRGSKLVARAGAAAQQWGAFVPGVPDVSQFPSAVWNKIQSKLWRKPEISRLTYSQGGGLPVLREAIADYLKGARSVICEPAQIIITNGTHQSIDLCLRLLSDPGDIAWIEDPCYWGARNLLRASGLHLRPIAVDAEGMNPKDEDKKVVPRFIFVTPSHQYPLGMVMSLSRRRSLLEYAAHHGSWIIEDDYDSEFRYKGRPLACLQGMDSAERVLYMGTFSKTMFPGLRLGYLVVPPGLTPAFITGMEELYRSGQETLQACMAEFMRLSYYHAHIRRMRLLYGTRLERLQNEIKHHFPEGEVHPMGSDAGLHLTLALPVDCNDQDIAQAALKQGIASRALSNYFHSSEQTLRGLVLGYANVSEDEISQKFNLLATIIKDHLNMRKIKNN